MVKPFATIYRDFPVDGVPQYDGSGNLLVHEPIKADIREKGAYLESLTQAAQYGNTVWFATKSLLNADLAHVAGVPANVYADTTPENNGIYIKAGASGAGSWGQIIDYLPGYQFVKASDAGAGTANAIQATTSPRVSLTDGAQLVTLNIFETTTSGTVTVAFDGGTALAIKTASGNNPASGGLIAGMTILGVVDGGGTQFKMVSDQSGAAIQAAAEAAQIAAALSASETTSAIATVKAWLTRDATSLAALAAASDGTVGTIAGYEYVVDSTATGVNSAGNGFSVNGLRPAGQAYLEHYGADGGADDSAAVNAANAAAAYIDLQNKTYNAPTSSNSTLTLSVFNGVLKVKNGDGIVSYRTRSNMFENDFKSLGTKCRVTGWSDKKVLWLGTSIPHQGTGVDSYPELIANDLNFGSITNNAWSGSFVSMHPIADVDPSGLISQILSLSMTNADVAAGLALYGSGTVYEDAYDPISYATQQTAEYRIGSAFIAGELDVVVLDHAHNDMGRNSGIIAPDATSAISSVTFGATTAITVADGTLFTVGDGVAVETVGSAKFAYAAARVNSVAGNVVTIDYESASASGTVTSGSMYKYDRDTILGSFQFLFYYIRGVAVYNGRILPKIILATPPSEYTDDQYTANVFSVSKLLRELSDEWGYSLFDIMEAYNIDEVSHIEYFPDGVHPSTLITRQAIANHWTTWMEGGAILRINEQNFMIDIGKQFADGELGVYDVSVGGFLPVSVLRSAWASVLNENWSTLSFVTNLWTTAGISTTIVAAPWDAGAKSAKIVSTTGTPTGYIYSAQVFDTSYSLDVEVLLPTLAGTVNGYFNLVQLDTVSLYIAVRVVVTAGVYSVEVHYFDISGAGGYKVKALTGSLPINTRFNLTVTGKRESKGEGYTKILIDGGLLGEAIVRDDSAQSNITSILLGTTSSTLGVDYTIYLGDIVAYKASTTPPVSGTGSTITCVNGLITAIS